MITLVLLICLSSLLSAEGAREDSQQQIQPMWLPEKPIILIVPDETGAASAAVVDALIPVIENRLKQKIHVRFVPEMAGEVRSDGYTWVAGTSMDLHTRTWPAYYAVSIPLLLMENKSPAEEYILACPAAEKESAEKVLALKDSGRLRILPGSSNAMASLIKGESSAALVRSTDAVSFLRSGRIDTARVLDSRPLKISHSDTIYPLQLINSTVIHRNPSLGIFLPTGTPEDVLNTLDSIWDHEIKNSDEIARWAADRGFAFQPERSRRNNE